MAKSNFAAGGGNARVAELKKRYPYKSDAGIRSMVEKMGERALAGRGSQTAKKLTDAQAFSYGGGNAALAKLKKKNGSNYSDSYLRSQIAARGRRAIAGRGDGSLPTPTTKPEGTTRNWRNGYGAQSDKPSSGDPSTWKKEPEPEKEPETDKKPITDKNNGGPSSGSSDSSDSSSSSSSGSSTTTRRNGAGVRTPLSGGAGGTRPTGPGPNQKPKSRLEKALSGIGKWEEPKEKPKRNKPTSRFLKKTNNSRRKER